jgi:hypothetical protein
MSEQNTEVGSREAYSGRLAYDPETDFHTDPSGRPVVTLDGGKTWYYALDDDFSHFSRYHERYAVVDTTANAAEPEPHHYEVQEDDAHYDGIKSDPDIIAERITSHTDAYKDVGGDGNGASA